VEQLLGVEIMTSQSQIEQHNATRCNAWKCC